MWLPILLPMVHTSNKLACAQRCTGYRIIKIPIWALYVAANQWL